MVDMIDIVWWFSKVGGLLMGVVWYWEMHKLLFPKFE
jgi:hypothetical protein